MQVLAVASRKGGSGKTTLAGHIAVEAERMGGGPVALVDTDPQASLSDWWNARRAETPAFARTAVERLAQDIAKMRAIGVRLLVVDTPPAITPTIEAVIAVSDLVLIPTRASPHDLRAASATVELVERIGKPLVFVLNAVSQRARITGEAAIALSRYGTLAPAFIHERTDFATSMIDGRTVMEIEGVLPAAEEIGALWEYLDNRLARIAGRSGAPDAAPAGITVRALGAPAMAPSRQA